MSGSKQKHTFYVLIGLQSRLATANIYQTCCRQLLFKTDQMEHGSEKPSVVFLLTCKNDTNEYLFFSPCISRLLLHCVKEEQ